MKKLKKYDYINRYGQTFAFNELENGDYEWLGNFGYSRIGFENDYGDAYNDYLKDAKLIEDVDYDYMVEDVNRNEVRLLTLDEFKEIITENQTLRTKYGRMVKSTNDINFVDPSGGPFISIGMDLDWINKKLKGEIVKEINKSEKGYLVKLM